MEYHHAMDISRGASLFQFFYLFAFIVAYAILLYEGYRRKFNLLSWILLLAAVRLAVVIGTKLFTFSGDEWYYMIHHQTLLMNHKKTLFGGIFMGVMAYMGSRYVLKFRHPVWDSLAYVLPVAVSIQSLGCFFYGCCFGSVTDLPWAVRYPVMSLAHYHQFESGILTHSDLYSLPVHPVQVYESIGGLLVAGIVFYFHRRWKASGSLLLSSLILFAMMRFGIEFFRDPLSNKTGGELIWIFKAVQWKYLAFSIFSAVLLVYRERPVETMQVLKGHVNPGLRMHLVFLSILVLVFFLLSNWFTLTEVIAVNVALLPAVCLLGYEFVKAFTTIRYKWVYAVSLLLAPVLMSQTIPPAKMIQAPAKEYKTYHTIRSGFATGKYTDEQTTYQGSGCDAVYNTQYFSHRYATGGAGYIFSKETTDKSELISYGINMNFGNYSQNNQTLAQETSWFVFDVNPFIKYDTRWVGIGGGLHMGNLIYTTGDTHRKTEDVPENGFIKTPVFPQLYLRVGIKKYFYWDFHMADQFPAYTPGMAFQSGFGSGFGLNNDMNLRFGLNYGTNLYPILSPDLYISAYLPFGNGLIVEPLLEWTVRGAREEYPVDLPEKQFSIGVSYRFGKNP